MRSLFKTPLPLSLLLVLAVTVRLGPCDAAATVVGSVNGIYQENVTVVEGKGLIVACNATESPDVDVWWAKNSTTGSEFYSEGIILRFNTINRFDYGQYLCYFNDTRGNSTENENATLATVVNIDVQYPANVLRIEGSPNVVKGNETFNIACWLVGNPGPDIRLYINETDRSIIKGSGIAANFTIFSDGKTCDNGGTYVCATNNSLDTEISKKAVKVEVLCKPEYDFTYNWPNAYLKARLGQTNVSFEVHTLGDPAPSFTWTKPGGTWPSATRQVNNPNHARLIFDNITIDSFGRYYLNVSNDMGSFLSNFSLTPTGPPETPKDLTLVNVTHDSATLSFFAGYDYGSSQRFKVMKIENNKFQSIYTFYGYDNHGRQTLTDTVFWVLTPETNYTLALQASNNEGVSQFSNQIQLRTLAAPDRHHHHNTNVGGIVGGVMGALGGIVGAIAGVCYYSQRRRRYRCEKV